MNSISSSFHRSIGISIKSLGPDENHRAHFFYLSAGFQGPIQSDSGMIVNLTLVDQWLQHLQHEFQGMTLEYADGDWELPLLLHELSLQMCQSLQELMDGASLPVQLIQFELKECRGGEHLQWKNNHWTWWVQHYIESVNVLGSVWRLRLGWNFDDIQEAAWQSIDFHRETLLLIKKYFRKNWEPDHFSLMKGYQHESGATISEVELQNIQSSEIFHF